jgi:hypothetical protein
MTKATYEKKTLNGGGIGSGSKGSKVHDDNGESLAAGRQAGRQAGMILEQ